MFDNKFINASYSDTKNGPTQIKDTLRLSFKNVSIWPNINYMMI